MRLPVFIARFNHAERDGAAQAGLQQRGVIRRKLGH